MGSIRETMGHVARKSKLVRRLHVASSGRKLFGEWPQWSRFADDWYDSRQDGRSSIVDRLPWLTYPAIEWLKSLDLNGKQVFEWGGGGSTLFFLDSGARVTTIEHDSAWASEIQRAISTFGTLHADLRLIEPEEDNNTNGFSPFRSSKSQYRQATFKRYVTEIESFDDQSFDLVLIDGRSRSSCLEYAAAKVRSGGSIVFDNAERLVYADAIKLTTEGDLATWTEADLTGPTPYLWDSMATTLVWTRN